MEKNLTVIGIGLLFLAVGGYLLVRWMLFRAGARTSRGTVIGHVRMRGKGGYVYAPVVQFYDHYTGRVWTFQASIYTGWRRRIGSTIAVAYRPEDPQQANTDTIGQRLLPLLAILAGAFIVFTGVKMFF
ncbi:MAG TPA: DUF3592 domain-containing protein [Ktedonobacteraceae bacterium]|nr:DUF3592 domain-containing protein [Ktedonobacteraceae bacterium]